MCTGVLIIRYCFLSLIAFFNFVWADSEGKGRSALSRVSVVFASSSSSSSSFVGVGFVFVCRSVFWGCVLCLFSLDVLVVASCVLFGQRTRCMLYVGCVLSLVSFVSVWFGCVAFIVLKS